MRQSMSGFARLRHLVVVLAVLAVGACGSAEDRAQGHYDRGVKLAAQKDYVRANIEFRNAVRLNKNLVGAWRELAQIEERNRNWPVLVSILQTVVELDQKDVDARLKLAKLLLLGNKLDEALKLANEASAIDPKNPGVLAVKAGILLRLNDTAGALREAKLALAINPSHSEAALVLAAERRMRGDLEGALKLIERFTDLNDLPVQLIKINILGEMKDLGRVEALLKQLSQHHPQQSTFRQQLVRLYLSQRRQDDAEKELRAIASADPKNIDAGLDVVRFLGAIGGMPAAEAELQSLIKAGGHVLRYQIALAELKLAQGKDAEGFGLLEKLLTDSKSREDTLTLQVRLAGLYFARKRFDDAEKVVANLLEADNRNIDGLRLRAALHLEHGRLEPAITDLRQALNDQSRATDVMLLLATAYERSGSIELAERQFADATRISNYETAAGLNYVAFLRRRGNVAHAEEVLSEMASRRPNDVRVLTVLAEVRLQRGNFAGAEQIADTIRKVNSNWSFIADRILGASFSGQQRFDESLAAAESAYNAAIPGAPQPMATLVNAYIRTKQIDKAIDMLQGVLRENPQHAEAHVLLGSIRLMQNAPDEARKSFQAAIDQRPQSPVGYRALADFHLRQGKLDEALAVIQAGLKQQPDNADLRLVLAGLLERKGDIEGAISEYETLVKAQPASMIFANNLASLLADHRNDKASLERAQTLASILRRSQVPQFMDTLGWVYFRQGNYKSAIPLLQEAAAGMPKAALVRYHLGRVYAALQERSKGVEELKAALELSKGDEDLQKKIQAALRELEG